MTQAERFVFITQLVKHRGPIRARRIAIECGVSERTVFRDISSLSRLRVPIYCDIGKGYRLAINTELKLGNIESNDADLVLFCLYHNPLANSPFFRRRMMYLKELLEQEFRRNGKFTKESVLLFDASYNRFAERHTDIILKFLYAVFKKYRVHLLEKGNLIKSLPFIPIGIRFKADGATLILFSEETDSDYRVDLEDLQGISITTSRFVDRPSTDMKPYRVRERSF